MLCFLLDIFILLAVFFLLTLFIRYCACVGRCFGRIWSIRPYVCRQDFYDRAVISSGRVPCDPLKRIDTAEPDLQLLPTFIVCLSKLVYSAGKTLRNLLVLLSLQRLLGYLHSPPRKVGQ